MLDNAPASPSRLSSLTHNDIPLPSPVMQILEPMRPKVFREYSVSRVMCLFLESVNSLSRGISPCDLGIHSGKAVKFTSVATIPDAVGRTIRTSRTQDSYSIGIVIPPDLDLTGRPLTSRPDIVVWNGRPWLAVACKCFEPANDVRPSSFSILQSANSLSPRVDWLKMRVRSVTTAFPRHSHRSQNPRKSALSCVVQLTKVFFVVYVAS